MLLRRCARAAGAGLDEPAVADGNGPQSVASVRRRRGRYTRSGVRFFFDGFVLDVGRGALLRDDTEIRLRAKSFDALTHLVRHAGRLVPKQELMNAVWPDTVVTDDSLVQCLMEIRRALGEAQGLIHTARGRGYRFDARVRVETEPGEPIGTPVPVEPALPAATVVARRHGRLWLAAAFVAIVIAAGAFLWLRPGPMPRDTGEARAPCWTPPTAIARS